jgi:peptidoglycan hydrolase-like protein with peptidoglycan-binding domain
LAQRLRGLLPALLIPALLAGVLSLTAAGAASAAPTGPVQLSASSTAPPAPGPVPASCTRHTFGPGSTGRCVTWIQKAANFNNYASGFGRPRPWYRQIAVSGSYGSATRAAVTGFQNGCNAAFGMGPGRPGHMSGGVVGPNTWTALETDCYQD